MKNMGLMIHARRPRANLDMGLDSGHNHVMSEDPRRDSRPSAILVALAIGGSAIGVVAWQMLGERPERAIDTSGFDLNTAPATAPARRSSTLGEPTSRESSSLGLLKSDAGITVLTPGNSGANSGNSASEGAEVRQKAAASLKQAITKNEKTLTRYFQRMEAKHPSLTQYGKDWVSYPDLKALRDQYWRTKDPIQFAYGLSRSENFGKLMKKYATDPGIREVLTESVKQAPTELLTAAGQVMQNDALVKNLISGVAAKMGLPQSLVGFLGGSSAKAPDSNQVLSEIMSSPDMKKALEGKR